MDTMSSETLHVVRTSLMGALSQAQHAIGKNAYEYHKWLGQDDDEADMHMENIITLSTQIVELRKSLVAVNKALYG